MDVKWTRDMTAESKMRQLGCKFLVVKDLSLDQVDIEGSRKNNARLKDPFDDDLALDYGEAMENGDAFPMPILRELPGRKKLYGVLSGNHRIGAVDTIDCAQKIDAYVVQTSDELVIEVIIRASNRWMGDRQKRDEAVEHAQVLVQKFDMSIQKVAKLFSLKACWLTSALRAEKVRDRLDGLLVDSRSLARGALTKLGQLEQSGEPVFRKAGHLVSRFNVPISRVNALVDEARDSKTEAEKLAALDRWEVMLRDEKHKNVTVTKSIKHSGPVRFRKHLNTLLHFIERGKKGAEFETLLQMQLTDMTDIKEVREIWRQCKAKIDGLFRTDSQVRTATNSSTVSKRRSKRQRRR